ncbi:MAG: hypothetical protein PHO27_07960 [Sulfuricurvum sp.]|nr:hypothetical protein [Sulfuricurvum sp.]
MKQLVLILSLVSFVLGSEYSVIISKKVPISTLTSQEVRDAFLQKRHTIKDQKLIPVNVIGEDTLRIAFESLVLEMDRNRLNAYWIKQHFQGVTPPITQPSAESVKAFVQNVEGAMGYIPATMVDNSVKVVYEF